MKHERLDGMPKTRADIIREMSDRELCKFIVELEENARRSPIVHGTKSTMEWLMEIVEEENGK